MGSIVLTAYDQQIGQQVVGAANTDGIEPGSDSQISVSGANIAYVTLGFAAGSGPEILALIGAGGRGLRRFGYE